MRSKHALVVAVCGVALIPGSASDAEFTHIEFEYTLMPGCARTARVYAVFTDPQDQLLAINGTTSYRLTFLSNVPLYNDGGLISGLIQEDMAAAPVSGPQDSWVTIGADTLFGNDTRLSPGFAGGDGIHSVVTGTEFEEDNGGWYDSDPSTPVTGTRILIAQLSLETDSPYIILEGMAAWKAPEGPVVQSDFGWLWHIDGGCAWDLDYSEHFGEIGVGDLLILLANWGECPVDCCLADFNADGEVGFEDLVTLLMRWGEC